MESGSLEKISKRNKERKKNMASDYKYGAQLIAEELAEERFGKTFYELSDEQQCELYGEGMNQYVERRLP